MIGFSHNSFENCRWMSENCQKLVKISGGGENFVNLVQKSVENDQIWSEIAH